MVDIGVNGAKNYTDDHDHAKQHHARKYTGLETIMQEKIHEHKRSVNNQVSK